MWGDLTTQSGAEPDRTRRVSSTLRIYLPVVLLVAIALSRLPFLDAGYGTNHDAWRVARAARNIAATGQYEVSRFPGNPMHEITCAFFRWGGPIALNGLSAAFSVAAAAALWLIARELNCRDAALLALAFAATPTVFINSVSSKDYVWAVAFVLWALYAAMRRQHAIAGVLFGLAIGCRITSGAMLLPLAIVLFGAHRDWRVIVRFCAFAGVTALVTFAPVWARYGWSFFTFYNDHARPDLATITARGTIELWGTLGVVGVAIALLAIIATARSDVTRSMPPLQNRFFMPALLTWLALYLIAFFALPDQAGYLIPLVPPLLLVLARYTPRRAMQFASICLLAAPWIDVAGGKLTPGPIIMDHRARIGTVRDVQRFVVASEEKLPPGTIIVVGAWQPIIEELFHRAPTRNRYVYLLSRAEAEQVARSGTPLAYATEMIRAFNIRVHGVDLTAYGARNVRQILVGAP